MPSHRVVVILDDNEYAQVVKNANRCPLSRYFRDLALAKETRAEDTHIPDVPKDATVRADAGRKSVPTSVAVRLREQIPGVTVASELPTTRTLDDLPLVNAEKPLTRKGAKTCVHGTAQGYRCWQCGGKANVQS